MPEYRIHKLSPLRPSTVGLIFITILILCSCSNKVPEPLSPSVDLVWPGGEETPRIRFVGSFSRPEDIQISKSFFQQFWGYIVGQEDNSLIAPYAISSDSKGNFLVVDSYLKKIHSFDTTAGKFHSFPPDDQPMAFPIGIATDDLSGKIYVTDSKEGLVKVFQGVEDSSPLTIGEGLLQRPTGVAVNKISNELLVVDTKLSHIFRFDLQNLRLLGRFGDKGEAAGEFNHPTNITVSADGLIIITDSLNFRIQVYSGSGKFLRTFGSAGDSPGHFSRPRGIACDSDNHIYVVDALFDNIQIFNREGQLLMDFGKSGREFGEFWMPAGIHIDQKDMIYVADSYNRRIQIFQYLKQDGSHNEDN